AVNLLAPIILVGGLLYLDQYEQTLIGSELDALRTNAELIAAAVGEDAVVVDTVVWEPDPPPPATPAGTGPEAGNAARPGSSPDPSPGGDQRTPDPGLSSLRVFDLKDLDAKAADIAARFAPKLPTVVPVSGQRLLQDASRTMIRRMAKPAGVRARLFGTDGAMVVDTRLLSGGRVQVVDLPPPDNGSTPLGLLRSIYDRILRGVPGDETLPVYRERAVQSANDYYEVLEALSGEPAGALRAYTDHSRLLSVAVPVQHYKKVVGALMLSKSTDHMEANLFSVRLAILEMFLATAVVTVLMSLYLAGTIARPVSRLAHAAERVRTGHAGRRDNIPDLRERNDEIGDLAMALNQMTSALWLRMDAIERFAADVAHEIKNPLTSLRSAVETVVRVTDPDRQRKLLAIIQNDVNRLDRLISDISDASRLDAELSRAEMAPVEIRRMLETLADVYNTTGAPGGLVFSCVPETQEGSITDPLMVPGMESRLVQVFRNMIANAISFSPPDGRITFSATRSDGWVVVSVEDEGPGLPVGKETAIFERFYTERPAAEKFGTHSGLGLAISRQIVEAHGGTILGENRLDENRHVLGARFVVRLPAG
ncbi:MAG: stimulus-sensing domain-containing protein, partial [Alphaproteobacteria bacterium]